MRGKNSATDLNDVLKFTLSHADIWLVTNRWQSYALLCFLSTKEWFLLTNIHQRECKHNRTMQQQGLSAYMYYRPNISKTQDRGLSAAFTLAIWGSLLLPSPTRK
jgi:hypothetical protein